MNDPIDHSNSLAVIRGYDDLHESLRRRADEMHVSRRTIDGLAGIADGLSEKILGPSQTKKFGIITLGAVLGALGCKLLLVEDPEARAAFDRRSPPKRVEYQVRHRSNGVSQHG